MKIVLANGVFDILHSGHIAHLREAQKMGDMLIVALTEDDFVGKGPGRPINTWEDRAQVLRELRCVSGLFPTRNAVEAIEWLRPDIFVKGIDYAGGNAFTEDVRSACERCGTEIRYTTSPKRSATDLILKTIGIYGNQSAH